MRLAQVDDDSDVVDNQKRRMKDVIGAAILECDEKLRVDIQFILDLGSLKIVSKPKSASEDEGYFTTPSTGSPANL